MDPGPLDMLHDPADQDISPVADRIDVDLDSVSEERVDQHRMRPAHPDSLFDVTLKFGLVMDDLHRPPAEDVRRPDQHRVADRAGLLPCLLRRVSRTVRRAWYPEPGEKPAEPVAVFSRVHGVR